MADDAILTELKSGGYVVYFRHAITDRLQTDADPITPGDCATQRNLSERGRTQARRIGAMLEARGITFDRVYSSPYCRANETASLAFPNVEVTDSPALFYSLGLRKKEAAQAAGDLRELLASQPPAGSNTALFGHTSNLKEVAGIWPKKEGGAFVFRPDGDGGFAFVGSIEPPEVAEAGS